MSRLYLGVSYKAIKAIKHALEYRLQREGISEKDYKFEKKILDDLNKEFDRWMNKHPCGCPRTTNGQAKEDEQSE